MARETPRNKRINAMRKLQNDTVHNVDLVVTAENPSQVLLLSDIHIDNPYSDIQLLKRLLNNALKNNNKVFIFGDLFDAMQSRHDKRRRKEEDISNSSAYFDDIIDEAFYILKPYSKIIEFISYGNHELSVLTHNNIDLLARHLVPKLNKAGGNIKVGNYSGFIRFRFKSDTKPKNRVNHTITMYYTHGSGGNAPMTGGLLQTHRSAIWIDADIIVGGHTHSEFIYPIMKLYATERGKIYTKRVLLIKTPTFKDESTLENTFASQKGFKPSPSGGIDLFFRSSPILNTKFNGISATAAPTT